jgi:predicted alpha/beta-fold hydrolase
MHRLTVFLLALVLAWAAQADSETYDYPIRNPLAATIVGTPIEYRAAVPESIQQKQLELSIFSDRKIPEIFWYTERLKYSLAYQDHRAPLIFIISGLGGDHNTARMEFLQRAFYQAGFHAVTLPSPTHPNFIVPASMSRVPGYIAEDALDLYLVMQLIWKNIQHRVDVSDFYLTGFSLGGAQSTFIARLDESERIFNFKKVLLINPPVSLYSSVRILDRMLEENIPGGMDHLGAFMSRVINRLAEAYKASDEVEFDEDFLYQAYRQDPPSDQTLAAIIGLAFRIAGGNMVFTSDVMTNSGYIVPKNRTLGVSDSLTDFAKVSFRISFLDYFNEYFSPYFRSRHPNLTEERLRNSLSLQSIESYLAGAEKIGVVMNEDDFILARGEVDYLRRLFKDRAKIYPTGGHGGNLEYKDNVAYMLDFFKR